MLRGKRKIGRLGHKSEASNIQPVCTYVFIQLQKLESVLLNLLPSPPLSSGSTQQLPTNKVQTSSGSRSRGSDPDPSWP